MESHEENSIRRNARQERVCTAPYRNTASEKRLPGTMSGRLLFRGFYPAKNPPESSILPTGLKSRNDGYLCATMILRMSPALAAFRIFAMFSLLFSTAATCDMN